MWDWFKNIFKRFNNNHEKEVAQPDQQSKQQQATIHTKVTYQYPAKTPFRFPVIPDDEPERRVSRSTRHIQEVEIGYNRDHTPIRRQAQPRKPFVPSEVPSPIYGYGKRTRRDESVPAYLRRIENQSVEMDSRSDVKAQRLEKDEASAVDDSHHHMAMTEIDKTQEEGAAANAANIDLSSDHTVEGNITAREESTVDQQEEPRETVQDHSVGSAIESHLTDTNSDESKQAHHHDDMNVQQEDHDDQPEQRKNKRHRRRERHRKNVQTARTNRRHEHQQAIPYNVMMTEQDKLLQSLKREKVEKQPQQSSTNEQHYDTIPYHLLNDPAPHSHEDDMWLVEQQRLLEETLKHFNVRAKVVHVTQGPTVTRFEVQPELGVKVSKVRNLSDDIKLNMAAKDIRIEAPIPGKNTIGIEVPNLKAQMVGLQKIFATETFKQSKSPLTIGLGLNVEGEPVVSNIAKMPHGLIAGATGSGKSVCINTILLSILYKASYEDVKLLLIDPKMVELAPYNGLPHLVSPVITDVKAATAALKWAVEEMEGRYEKFVEESVRDIGRYNDKMIAQQREDDKMPYIVIVIDELADLMMASPQDVEDAICRIAQKARACGIHLLLATQRPSVDVITGLIKANIPTRIAFSVSSQVDSRTIIDMNGAERLLGKGDMLFIENGANQSIRIQGAFVSDEEIERVTNYVRKIAPPRYLFEQEQLIQMEMIDEEDELLQDVIEFVVSQNQASTSLLQRQFRIGYNRAARLIDTLEARGIISGQKGSKPRDVLLSKVQIEEMI